MPQGDAVTVYNADGSKSIQVERNALKEAIGNGWRLQSTPKPTAQPSPQKAPGGASPQQGGFGTGSIGPATIPPVGFAQGFDKGGNPMHTAPPGTPQMGGTISNALLSGLNIPEITQRVRQKNYSGAAGEALGTASGAGMQFGGAAMKEAGLAGRAATDVARSAKAAVSGAGLSRELKVTPEAARFAERFIQPLKGAIDSQFAPVHAALEGKPFLIPAPMQRMIRKMAKSEVPAISKIAGELNGRTALDYQEGKALMEHMKDILHDEDAKNWKPEVSALTKMIDGEIDTLAQKYGFGPQRRQLMQQYTKLQQILRSVASGASTTEGKMKPVADMVGGVGPGIDVGAVRVGMRGGSGKAMKIPKEAQVEAEKLGRQLGVKPGELKVGPGAMEKTGKATQAAGAGMDIAKLARVVMMLMAGKQQDPYAGRQAQ